MTYLGSVFDYNFFYNDKNGNYAVILNKRTVANPSTLEDMQAYMKRVSMNKRVHRHGF